MKSVTDAEGVVKSCYVAVRTQISQETVKLFSRFNERSFGYFDPMCIYFLTIKINSFQGDLSNISSKTATLSGMCRSKDKNAIMTMAMTKGLDATQRMRFGINDLAVTIDPDTLRLLSYVNYEDAASSSDMVSFFLLSLELGLVDAHTKLVTLVSYVLRIL